MTPDVRAKPIFSVTNPNVIKTNGDAIIRINNGKEILLCSLAQIVLIELQKRATATAHNIYAHDGIFFIISDILLALRDYVKLTISSKTK